MVGLAMAGNETVLYKLKLAEVVTTVLITGSHLEATGVNSIVFTVWDAGDLGQGPANVAPLLPEHSRFHMVVDSNGRERVNEAHEKLMRLPAKDGL